MARKIQIGPDGRLRMKAGKVILANANDPCCCGDEPGPLYRRLHDCCNIHRVLWVLVDMLGPCLVIARVGGLGTVECWAVETGQEPLTAAQIADVFPGEAIDAPDDPSSAYPCGTCGVEPCPACPDCCMRIIVYPACGIEACCNVGRKFRVRYDVVTTSAKRWIPEIFFAPDCGGLLAQASMFVDYHQSFVARGSFLVERVRNGNTCDPPTILCEGGAFIRRIRHQEGPSGPSTLSGCTITTPPRVVQVDEDFTENECFGNPFDLDSFRVATNIGREYNDYGPGTPNTECASDGNGGLYPYSGSWSGTNNSDDWTSGAGYVRSLSKGCDGLSLDESYHETFRWNQLPTLIYTADWTNQTTVTVEILDADCGADPCSPPDGGGGGGLNQIAGLLRGSAGGLGGVTRAGMEALIFGRSMLGKTRSGVVGGCRGCGSNGGVRVVGEDEMRMALAKSGYTASGGM